MRESHTHACADETQRERWEPAIRMDQVEILPAMCCVYNIRLCWKTYKSTIHNENMWNEMARGHAAQTRSEKETEITSSSGF